MSYCLALAVFHAVLQVWILDTFCDTFLKGKLKQRHSFSKNIIINNDVTIFPRTFKRYFQHSWSNHLRTRCQMAGHLCNNPNSRPLLVVRSRCNYLKQLRMVMVAQPAVHNHSVACFWDNFSKVRFCAICNRVINQPECFNYFPFRLSSVVKHTISKYFSLVIGGKHKTKSSPSLFHNYFLNWGNITGDRREGIFGKITRILLKEKEIWQESIQRKSNLKEP